MKKNLIQLLDYLYIFYISNFILEKKTSKKLLIVKKGIDKRGNPLLRLIQNLSSHKRKKNLNKKENF